MSRPADVVVTGVGLTVAPGLSVSEAWSRALAGQSGIGTSNRLNVSSHSTKALACVPDFDVTPLLKYPKNQKFMAPFAKFLMRAAKEAVTQSGIDCSEAQGDRIGAYVAAGQVGPEPNEFFRAFGIAKGEQNEPNWELMGGRAARLVDPYFPLRTLGNAGLALIAIEFGIHGPSSNHAQSDVAGLFALDEAIRDLRQGACDAAVVGACDSLITSACFLTFARAGLLSPAASDVAYRPFDQASDGLVLGEGAAVLVVERAEAAMARGATVLAYIDGIGTASDVSPDMFPGLDVTGNNDPHYAYGHTTTTDAILQATAGTVPNFVIACGSGIPDRDRSEAAALRKMFGDVVPCTAFKSLTGYVGAATGLVETVFAICAARERLVPPIARLDHPEPGIGLNLVREAPQALDQDPCSGLVVTQSWTGQSAAVLIRSAA